MTNRFTVHGKFVDSLSVRAKPVYPKKYDKFITKFCEEAFQKGRGRRIPFLGEEAEVVLNYSNSDGRPIRVKKDGKFIIGFTKKIPREKSPILIQFVQPTVWQNPLQKLKKLKRDLETHVGELHLEIERIDISLMFSGWAIDDDFYNSIRTATPNVASYKKDGVISSIAIGTYRGDIPFTRIYNKSTYLRKHPQKPSPAPLFTEPEPWGRDYWNLEFSFNHNTLKHGFGLVDPDDVFKAIPKLWLWATKDYFYISEYEDKNHVHPLWRESSEAIGGLSDDYFKRKSRKKKDPNVEFRKDQLFKKAKSYAESIGVDWKELLSGQLLDDYVRNESASKENE